MAIKINDTKRITIPMYATTLETLADEFDKFSETYGDYKLTQTYRSQGGSELVLTFEESN